MLHFLAIEACSTATICPFICPSSAAVCLSPPTKNAAGQKTTTAAAVAQPSQCAGYQTFAFNPLSIRDLSSDSKLIGERAKARGLATQQFQVLRRRADLLSPGRWARNGWRRRTRL